MSKKKEDVDLFVEFYEKSNAKDPINILSMIQLLQFIISESTIKYFDYISLRRVA